MPNVNLAQSVVDRTGLLTGEDDAIFTSHWRNMIPAQPDTNDMDHAARVSATQKLSTFFQAIAGMLSTLYVFREVRWYDVDPTTGKTLFIESLIPPNFPKGTATGAVPPQVASSVTFRTAVRKNWGRFYVPGLVTGQFDQKGQLTNGAVDTLCTAAVALTDRGGVTIKPTLTVWSRAELTHHDPQQVVVDSVPDIIRRRRFSVTTYKKILPAG